MSNVQNSAVSNLKCQRALSGDEGYVPLSASEERDLARRAREGDDEAAWTLCMANQNFVRSLAQRYLRNDIEIEDLVGEGMVGLLQAARRFDADHGVKFITYGAWWIKRAMLTYLRTFEHPVHVPKYKNLAVQAMRRTRQGLAQDLGRAPGLRELQEASHESERSVHEIAGLLSSHESLDDANSLLRDTLGGGRDVEAEVIRRDALRRLEAVLLVLSERERQVLHDRFGLEGREEITLSELGRRMGLTKERVRQIEKKACDRLRVAMRDAAVPCQPGPVAA